MTKTDIQAVLTGLNEAWELLACLDDGEGIPPDFAEFFPILGTLLESFAVEAAKFDIYP
jgi:hypothetical protein